MKDQKIIIILVFMVINTLLQAVIELDTDQNGRTDRWIDAQLFSEWRKHDVNRNGQPDESWFYVSERGIIHLIASEQYDTNADGIKEVSVTHTPEGNNIRTVLNIDRNDDGKPDYTILKFNDVPYEERYDNNFNGYFENIEEVVENGFRLKESVDTNENGRMNEFYYYVFINPETRLPGNKWLNDDAQGKIPVRYELDTNHDGQLDMWVVFNYNTTWEIVQGTSPTIIKDNNFDGKPDEWHYTDARRQVIRIERDQNFDGVVDKVDRF